MPGGGPVGGYAPWCLGGQTVALAGSERENVKTMKSRGRGAVFYWLAESANFEKIRSTEPQCQVRPIFRDER